MSIRSHLHPLGPIFAAVLFVACSSSGTGPGTSDPIDGIPEGPTRKVTAQDEIPANLRQALTEASQMDASTLTTTYPAPASTTIAYDASGAKGLDLIQASSLALNDSELEALTKNGLVISKRKQFPSFAYGYKSIYAEDLPVYVSADSILEAVHRTFDSLLKQTEELVLAQELSLLLSGMRGRVETLVQDRVIQQDADLYLTLAASLLKGRLLDPFLATNAPTVAQLYDLATAAKGHQIVTLFGVKRDEDFSQFVPRGHYADSEALQRYFKAMMWLGRVDLRLVETQPDGAQLFYRRQFDAAVALRELLGDSEFTLWKKIDDVIGAYVGEHDNLTPKGLDALMASLSVSNLAQSVNLKDTEIIDALAQGGWGEQRIASRIIIKGDLKWTRKFGPELKVV